MEIDHSCEHVKLRARVSPQKLVRPGDRGGKRAERRVKKETSSVKMGRIKEAKV